MPCKTTGHIESWQWRLALGIQLLSLGRFGYIHGRQVLSLFMLLNINSHLRSLLNYLPRSEILNVLFVHDGVVEYIRQTQNVHN